MFDHPSFILAKCHELSLTNLTVVFDQVGKDGTVQKVTEQTGIEGTAESYKKFMQLVCNTCMYT